MADSWANAPNNGISLSLTSLSPQDQLLGRSTLANATYNSNDPERTSSEMFANAFMNIQARELGPSSCHMPVAVLSVQSTENTVRISCYSTRSTKVASTQYSRSYSSQSCIVELEESSIESLLQPTPCTNRTATEPVHRCKILTNATYC